MLSNIFIHTTPRKRISECITKRGWEQLEQDLTSSVSVSGAAPRRPRTGGRGRRDTRERRARSSGLTETADTVPREIVGFVSTRCQLCPRNLLLNLGDSEVEGEGSITPRSSRTRRDAKRRREVGGWDVPAPGEAGR